jgi:hypothetical protein
MNRGTDGNFGKEFGAYVAASGSWYSLGKAWWLQASPARSHPKAKSFY